MSDDTYNGYPNRETWAAALHQDNDEGIYDRVRGMAAEARENNSDASGDAEEEYNRNGARYELAQALEQMWDEFADPEYYGEYEAWAQSVFPMLSDVGSLWRVDWDFIADSILSE